MSGRRAIRSAALFLAVAFAAVAATAAHAHVGIEPAAIPAASTRTVTFTVPHGCAGSPTTRLAIRFPAWVETVEPRPAPSWESEVAVDAEGGTVVTWTGGTIPDGERGEFRVRLRVAPEAGEAIFLPTVQTCKEGRYRWIQLPADGETERDLDTPAPRLALLAPEPETTDPTLTTAATTTAPATTTTTTPHAAPETIAADTDAVEATTVVEPRATEASTFNPWLFPASVAVVVIGAGGAIILLRRRRP